MERYRNDTIDLLKLFAAYMVVFVHVRFWGIIGDAADALARFAVPFFFTISGYFSYQIPLSKIKKRIRETLRLLFFACVLNALFYILLYTLHGNGNSLWYYFDISLSPKAMIALLFFNVPLSFYHLWYLLALIYVYLIFYFTAKQGINDKLLFAISVFLLTLHLILGELLSMFNITVSIVIVRNFLLTGLPFFGLGMLAKKHEASLKTVPNYILVILLAAGITETLFSRFLFGANELYIGSVFIVFAIISFALKLSDRSYSNFLVTWASSSTYIYILHVMISDLLTHLYSKAEINYAQSPILQMIHPFTVCLLSTIFSLGINQITQKHWIMHSKTSSKISAD